MNSENEKRFEAIYGKPEDRIKNRNKMIACVALVIVGLILGFGMDHKSAGAICLIIAVILAIPTREAFRG